MGEIRRKKEIRRRPRKGLVYGTRRRKEKGNLEEHPKEES